MNLFSAFKKTGVDYIVVGLGNPGKQYDHTRHNIGFSAVDYIAQKLSVQLKKLKFSALYERCEISNKSVLLVKPQTYMNNSGEAVAAAARFYKVPVDKIIVISDDISLPCGVLRVRKKGSAGGHNGLKSINRHLGSEEYPRIKIGVGEKPNPEYDLADWVLSTFSSMEEKAIEKRFPDVLHAVEHILNGDFETAMNQCNRNVV